jgi:MFS family permease
VTIASTEAPRSDEGGFFALMRHRNYALLWIGQFISQVGDRFHWVAISLWVFSVTGSALSVSYAIVALMVGPALVGVFAGSIVDRFDRRKILIYADLARAALVFAIPQLMERGLVWVYVDLFLVSAASAFFRPAMFAAIPQSVPKDRLLAANAFFASMDSSTEVFGPALAGLLFSLQGLESIRGYQAAIYLDGLTYLVSALFVSGLSLPAAEGPAVGGPPASARGSIREGLRYIRQDRIQIALLGFLVAGQWVVGLSSLQTPLAKQVLAVTDRQFGWFQSVWGMGFVAASLLLGWYGGGIPKGRTIVFAYLLWAASAAMMGIAANYGMLVVAGFWVGFANMLLFVSAATILMEYTPSDRMGRVISTRQVTVALVRTAALLGFGWLADQRINWLADPSGVRAAILVMAGLSAVGTVVAAIAFPAIWRYLPAFRTAQSLHAPDLRAFDQPRGSLRGDFFWTHVDPEFIVTEQVWLNIVVLVIVGVGWLVMLVTLPGAALGVLAVILATVLAYHLVRAVLKRLRPLLEKQP